MNTHVYVPSTAYLRSIVPEEDGTTGKAHRPLTTTDEQIRDRMSREERSQSGGVIVLGGCVHTRAGNDQPQVSETLSARASEPHHHGPFGVLACALQDLSCITVLTLNASSRYDSQKCHWTLLGVLEGQKTPG